MKRCIMGYMKFLISPPLYYLQSRNDPHFFGVEPEMIPKVRVRATIPEEKWGLLVV